MTSRTATRSKPPRDGVDRRSDTLLFRPFGHLSVQVVTVEQVRSEICGNGGVPPMFLAAMADVRRERRTRARVESSPSRF